MNTYEFIGDYNGKPLFFKADGTAASNVYITLVDSDGNLLLNQSPFTAYAPEEVGTSPGYANVRLQGTNITDEAANDTPLAYPNLSFADLAIGRYTLLVLAGAAYDSALQGRQEVYWDGSKWWPATAAPTKPRINELPSVILLVAQRSDGTYIANKPVRLIAGTFDTDKAIGLDMSTYFGKGVQPSTVGTPTVSSGSITCTALGPRDELAMVQLGGTATAGEEVTINVPVTMDNGDQLTARFQVEVEA